MSLRQRSLEHDMEVQALWSSMSASEVARRFEALLDITDSVLEHIRIDETLHQLAERIRTATGAETATVLLKEPGLGQRLRIRASSRPEPTDDLVGTTTLNGLAGRVAERRMALIFNEPDPAEEDSPLMNGISCAMAAPLLLDEAVMGVVQVGSSEVDAFGYVDLHFLQLLADRVAVALDRARDQDESAGRAKGNFLAIMSHELRTPLNSIIGYGEILEDEMVGPLNLVQREHVERIRESGWHLLELINQILSISRVEPEQEEVKIQPIDAEQHAIAAAGIIRPAAVRKGLALNVEAPASAVIISTDPDRLHQILVNILTNAVKFTPEGDIRLKVIPNGESVDFRVTDTGIGIAGHHLGSVFEPFWQADQSNTRLAGGTGLGLQVARTQARLIGGDLSVESRPGAGSTFTLHLPMGDRSKTLNREMPDGR